MCGKPNSDFTMWIRMRILWISKDFHDQIWRVQCCVYVTIYIFVIWKTICICTVSRMKLANEYRIRIEHANLMEILLILFGSSRICLTVDTIRTFPKSNTILIYFPVQAVNRPAIRICIHCKVLRIWRAFVKLIHQKDKYTEASDDPHDAISMWIGFFFFFSFFLVWILIPFNSPSK